MLCADCLKEFPMSKLRFKPDGIVKNSHGMKAHKAQCPDCSRKIVIDDTTMKTREPGEDG